MMTDTIGGATTAVRLAALRERESLLAIERRQRPAVRAIVFRGGHFAAERGDPSVCDRGLPAHWNRLSYQRVLCPEDPGGLGR